MFVYFTWKFKCDAFRDLVPFVQFKKREKTPPWVFFTFFKLYKSKQIAQRITNIFLEALFLISEQSKFQNVQNVQNFLNFLKIPIKQT